MNEYLESLATDFDPRDVRPVFEDRVLIKRLPLKSEDRGLVIPESARSEKGLLFGEVISVGRGFTGRSQLKKDWTGDLVSVVVPFKPAKVQTCEVKPGDKVLYERFQQHEFFLHGETYNFVFEEQFIAAIVF
jgi:co-chaperonin GroES (HSP10)